MILETSRLALHELRPDDAPFILDLLMSRGFRENIGDRGVRDLDGARKHLDRAVQLRHTGLFLPGDADTTSGTERFLRCV